MAIVQGATYDKLNLKLEGDYSEATFKAQIRNAPLELEGELLASFSFQQINYDGDTNKTTVVPILTAEQTSAIPSTKYDGDDSRAKPSQKNCWVWDFEAVLPEKVTKIPISFVQVTAEVTD
ncbi:hypothetical protein GM3709_2315 [Geminocystis sp. NIES-3709]|nr:hypothetical protein GM3709_2315 [Geminocystis sp. NIES-3709]